MRYRVVYLENGSIEYVYCDYMAEVGMLIRTFYPNFADYRIEVRGTDDRYHSLSAWSPK